MTASTTPTTVSLAFRHLGVPLHLTSDDPAAIDYLHAFVDPYLASTLTPGEQPIEVTVRRGVAREPAGAVRVPVQRASAYPHWNLDALVAIGDDGVVRLHQPERGVRADWDAAGRRLDVVVQPGVTTDQFAGQLVYLLVRNLALHLRDDGGYLVHGSAVATAAGDVVAFSGPSMSGKTTCMVQSVLREGAAPFANDRVWLRPGAGRVDAVPWPSYLTLCEGTIGRYPELRAGVHRYESDGYRFRTHRFGTTVGTTFVKAEKRQLPQAWFAEVAGRPYLAGGRLRRFCRVRVDPGVAVGSVVEEDPADPGVVDHLDAESFERGRERSFRPWHGMPLPTSRYSAADLASALRSAGVRVSSVTLNPLDLAPLREVLS